MIALDRHVWVWWVLNDPKLIPRQRQHIAASEPTGLGISVISCWEVAQLVAGGRLSIPQAVDDWVLLALGYPSVRLLDLTPSAMVEATRLPGVFHKDPADRFIVATARELDVPVLTADAKILAYPHVRTLT